MAENHTIALNAVIGDYVVTKQLPSKASHGYWEITCKTCHVPRPIRASHLRNGRVPVCCTPASATPTAPALPTPTAAPTAAPAPTMAPAPNASDVPTNEHLASLFRSLDRRLMTAERTIEALQFQLKHLDSGLSPEGRAAWAENLRWHSLSIHQQMQETELEDAKKREAQAALQVERRQQSLIKREQELESLKINLERIHALTATPFAERTPEGLQELKERIHVEVLDIDKHLHEMERCAERRDTLLPAYQAVKDWNFNMEEMTK